MFIDKPEKEIARPAHPPTENHAGRVERVLDVDAGDGQVTTRFVPNPQTKGVAALGGCDHSPGINQLAGFNRFCEDTGLALADCTRDSAPHRRG